MIVIEINEITFVSRAMIQSRKLRNSREIRYELVTRMFLITDQLKKRPEYGERYSDDLCRIRLREKTAVKIVPYLAARYSDDKNAILTTKSQF